MHSVVSSDSRRVPEEVGAEGRSDQQGSFYILVKSDNTQHSDSVIFYVSGKSLMVNVNLKMTRRIVTSTSNGRPEILNILFSNFKYPCT